MRPNNTDAGYDFAMKQIEPLVSYLIEDTDISKLSQNEKIDYLLSTAQTFPPLFKQGIAKCIDDWWRRQESIGRVRPVPPLNNNPCLQCGQLLPFDDDGKAQHFDVHFRSNKICSALNGDIDQSAQLKSRTLAPNGRGKACLLAGKDRTTLQQMLKQPLREKTRAFIMERLNPELKNDRRHLATTRSSWIANDNSTSQIARGWFAPKTKWISNALANVPVDIVQYGRMQMPNGDGFWLHTFGKSLVAKPHWNALLQHSQTFCNSSASATPKMQLTPLLVPTPKFGSKYFMQLLSSEQRAKLLRADDRYDESLCSLCGVRFDVVLSEDPTDTLGEDFVFLDALPHPTIKADMLHTKCAIAMRRSKQLLAKCQPPPSVKTARSKLQGKPKQNVIKSTTAKQATKNASSAKSVSAKKSSSGNMPLVQTVSKPVAIAKPKLTTFISKQPTECNQKPKPAKRKVVLPQTLKSKVAKK
jgi:hypothetical protein